jgi:hypothetical protein
VIQFHLINTGTLGVSPPKCVRPNVLWVLGVYLDRVRHVGCPVSDNELLKEPTKPTETQGLRVLWAGLGMISRLILSEVTGYEPV